MKVTNKTYKDIEAAKLNIQLNQPTINKTLDVWTENYKLYLVSELGKCNLKELLDNYIRLDEQTFWALAADISLALQECQKNDIVHLDVKPDNILVWQLTQQPSSILESMKSQTQLTLDPVADNMQLLDSQTIKDNHQGFIEQSTINNNESQRIQFTESSPQFNYTPDNLTYEQLQNNQFSMQLSAQRLGNYIQPLQMLNVSALISLRNTCLFQLIDFGMAQKIKQNQQNLDIVSGDNAYVDLQLIKQQKLSFECDSVSLGLTLFECITGVYMPTTGPLFEQIRTSHLFDNLDKDVFGVDINKFLQGEKDQQNSLYSKEVYQAIYDLVVNRMPIQNFRDKYEIKFDLMQRQTVYQTLIDVRIKNQSIADSQIENRIFVIDKQILRKYLQKREEKSSKIKRIKKIQKMYKNGSKDLRKKIIQTNIKNVSDFIKYGAYFMNKQNKSDAIKKQLQSTITQIELTSKSPGFQDKNNDSMTFSNDLIGSDEFFREENMNLSSSNKEKSFLFYGFSGDNCTNLNRGIDKGISNSIPQQQGTSEQQMKIINNGVRNSNINKKYINEQYIYGQDRGQNQDSINNLPLISSDSKIINIFDQLVGGNTIYKYNQCYQSPKFVEYSQKEDKTTNLIVSDNSNQTVAIFYSRPLWEICFAYNFVNIIISYIRSLINNQKIKVQYQDNI